jgi:hypothetical protein
VPHGRGRRRAVAGLGLESEPGTRLGKTPMGGAHLAVRERKGRRRAPVWLAGPRGVEEKKKRPAELGLAG